MTGSDPVTRIAYPLTVATRFSSREVTGDFHSVTGRRLVTLSGFSKRFYARRQGPTGVTGWFEGLRQIFPILARIHASEYSFSPPRQIVVGIRRWGGGFGAYSPSICRPCRVIRKIGEPTALWVLSSHSSTPSSSK